MISTDTTASSRDRCRRTLENMEYNPEPPMKRMKMANIVRVMSSQQYLPANIIEAILARLPAKTLIKFRCVCKSWNSLIQEDDYFVEQHLSTPSILKKRGMLFLSRHRSFQHLKLSYEFTLCHSLHGSKIHKIDFGLAPRPYSTTNYCDGLVGVYSGNSFCLANPSIMKLAVLPRGSKHFSGPRRRLASVAAIGFEASKGEYKVARLFARKKSIKPRTIGCEVFYLGRNKHHSGWKLIDDPPVLGYMYNFNSPVVFNGVIYWTVERKSRRSEIALSFDLREEKFSVLLHPKGSSRPFDSMITSLGGCLCVADTLLKSRTMDIWALKDDRNSKWVKQYNIRLSELYRPQEISLSLVKPVTSADGRIVIHYRRDSSDDYEYYDPLTKSTFKHEKLIESEFLFPYTGSIVWPWR